MFVLLVMTASGPAFAADFGSAREYRVADYGAAAVPVPAPIPVPVERADWYMRLDAGAVFGADPDVSATIDDFDIGSGWFRSDSSTLFTVGGGVGYYWSSRFRTDITVDYNGEAEASAAVDATMDDDSFSIRDQVKQASTTFLFNAYYDFLGRSRFTPYIGAGIGFAINRLKRDNALDIDCPTCGIDYEGAISGKEQNVTFAAMATVGFSYEITPVTMLDVNYRFLHIAGSDIDLDVGPVPTTVSVGDINEHQVRAGLRFNVN